MITKAKSSQPNHAPAAHICTIARTQPQTATAAAQDLHGVPGRKWVNCEDRLRRKQSERDVESSDDTQISHNLRKLNTLHRSLDVTM